MHHLTFAVQGLHLNPLLDALEDMLDELQQSYHYFVLLLVPQCVRAVADHHHLYVFEVRAPFLHNDIASHLLILCPLSTSIGSLPPASNSFSRVCRRIKTIRATSGAAWPSQEVFTSKSTCSGCIKKESKNSTLVRGVQHDVRGVCQTWGETADGQSADTLHD